ncbi:MAG TPA: caspase family protein [Saprospiraceae bacterium]|nr:caspase family protein [Saprospiraceae bacterium]
MKDWYMLLDTYIGWTKTLLILLIVGCSFHLHGEKYGLIIAIGNYPTDSGWQCISSLNDVTYAEAALHSLGFSEAHITVIKDNEATKQKIIDAFLFLREKVSKGDIVFIHFSGHGQQVLDDNNDEIDGLDEAIVPYDSPMRYVKESNEGQYLIRDDFIGVELNKLRQLCGNTGQVILVFDSCHSGTVVRGLGKCRGTDVIMAPSNFIEPPSSESSIGLNSINGQDLAPYFSFYGSSAKELNFESLDLNNQPVGSLSFSLYSSLVESKELHSWKELYDMVKLKMKKSSPRQHPQYEGMTDTPIFDRERRIIQENSILNMIDKQRIEIEGGSLNGISEGTNVEIYDKSTGDFIAKGEVVNADLVSSKVNFSSQLNLDDGKMYFVKVSDDLFTKEKLSIYNALSDSSPWSNILDSVMKIGFVLKSLNPNADISILEAQNNVLDIVGKDGYYLSSFDVDGDNIFQDIKAILVNTLQCNYLRSLHETNPKYDFSLAIIEVDKHSREELILTDNKELNIKRGTHIKFRIVNEGIAGAYFSLIDIQPDNQINVIIPSNIEKYTAEDFFLKPGEFYVTNFDLEVAEPLGEETVKLFVTSYPLNISRLLGAKGVRKKGIIPKSRFEQLLFSNFDSDDIGSSGFATRGKDKITTSTLFFNIVD